MAGTVSAKFLENVHTIHAFPAGVPSNVDDCGDMFNNDPQSDIVSLHGAQRIVFFIINNGVGATAGSTVGGTATITMEGVRNVLPAAGSTCPLTFRVRVVVAPDTNNVVQNGTQSFVTHGYSDRIYLFEADACQLPSCTTDANFPHYEYARMKVVESTDKAVHGAYVALLDGLRDAEDVLPSQVV